MALPLQVGAFADLPGALRGLGIAAEAEARLTDSGDLLVDLEAVETAATTYLATASAGELLTLQQEVERRCEEVRRLAGAAAGDADPRGHLGGAGRTLRDFMPLPVLGKAVTGAFLAALRDDGYDGPPPVPRPSSGLRLVGELADLAAWCRRHGWPATALAAAWPGVPGHVVGRLSEFAASHAGFGPLAWEAPGLGDVTAVVESLSLLDGVVSPPPGWRSAEAPPSTARGRALHGLLHSWLDATENGILYTREAFRGGVRAGLARLGGSNAADLLFLTLEEISAGVPPDVVVGRRREAYWADTDYLERHGIGPSTLEELFR